MKIILIGPQGSGKGTQGELISKRYKIPHIDIGELFREEAANKTKFGLDSKQYWEKGKLVPDEMTFGFIKSRLSKPDCKKGFVMEGFPRTVHQAQLLDSFVKLDLVIELAVPDEIGIKRISSRRICSKCEATYGHDARPKKEGICDKCGGKLVQREDDKPEMIKRRLEIYHTETEPILGYYRLQRLVKTADASKTIPEVFEEIKKILG